MRLRISKALLLLCLCLLFPSNSQAQVPNAATAPFEFGPQGEPVPTNREPAGASTASPGGHPVALIGRRLGSTRNGWERAFAQKTFGCSGRKNFCTVRFSVIFHKKDAERLRIVLSGTETRKAFMTDLTATPGATTSAREFKLSVRGCGESTIRFSVDRGTNPDIQSLVEATVLSAVCTESDETNGLGAGYLSLKDENGMVLKPSN